MDGNACPQMGGDLDVISHRGKDLRWLPPPGPQREQLALSQSFLSPTPLLVLPCCSLTPSRTYLLSLTTSCPRTHRLSPGSQSTIPSRPLVDFHLFIPQQSYQRCLRGELHITMTVCPTYSSPLYSYAQQTSSGCRCLLLRRSPRHEAPADAHYP